MGRGPAFPLRLLGCSRRELALFDTCEAFLGRMKSEALERVGILALGDGAFHYVHVSSGRPELVSSFPLTSWKDEDLRNHKMFMSGDVGCSECLVTRIVGDR